MHSSFVCESWDPKYFDDITGFPLDPVLVKQARDEEIRYLTEALKVWEIVDRDAGLALMHGVKAIPVRWVDINKGSEAAPEYRSRLVVMETKRRSTIDPQDKGAVFAATPPLEALRLGSVM